MKIVNHPASTFNFKRIFYWFIFCLFTSTAYIVNCKNPSFNNVCDPNSRAYQDSLLVKALTSDKSIFCGLVGASTSGTGSGTSTGTSTGTTTSPTAPTITNLLNKSIVHTGFLIGTASASVSSVEVSIDGGAYSPATGTSSWKFQLPSGSSTWKEFSQHTITARTIDGVGTASSTVSITVRKGANRDINGDGYADLVIGAPNAASNGVVYIFYGSSSGIASANDTSAITTLTGTTASAYFGISVTSGDYTGDGYADVAVGAYGDLGTMGKIYIFHSTGTGGITSVNDSSASASISGTSASGYLGVSLASGDINGDGYADLAAGGYNIGSALGKAFVFHSSATSSGITINAENLATTTLSGDVANGTFGVSVAIGDITGDGYGDVAVGAGTLLAAGLGNAYIFHGGSGGIADTAASSANTVLTGTLVTGSFGRSIAIGDINGDGYQDIAVGATTANTNHGYGYIFYSAGGTGIASVNDVAATTIITGTLFGKLGSSVAIGDMDNDGYGDLLIGAFAASGNMGSAYIFKSPGAYIANQSDVSATSAISGTIGSGLLGQSSLFSDINGDGYSDAIISAHGVSANLGKLYIFQSPGTSGISGALTDSSATSTLSGTVAAGEFGNVNQR